VHNSCKTLRPHLSVLKESSFIPKPSLSDLSWSFFVRTHKLHKKPAVTRVSGLKEEAQ
jgi:hypothetical protein